MTQIHNACSFQEWNLGHCREIKLADKFCQRKFVRPEIAGVCWRLLAPENQLVSRQSKGCNAKAEGFGIILGNLGAG